MKRNKKHIGNSHSGFGLVELLVVIAIMSILVAIGSSVINRVRSAAEESGCITNLRTLAAAGLMYANDREGQLPDLGDWRSERAGRRLQFSLIPYIYGYSMELTSTSETERRQDDYAVLSCPVALGHTEFRTRDNPGPEDGTYSINPHSAGSNDRESSIGDWDQWVKNNRPLFYIQRFQEPERTPFFLDGVGQSDSYGNRYSIYSNQARAKVKIDRNQQLVSGRWQTPYLHTGDTLAIAFLDGHVELVTHEQVSAEPEDGGLLWKGHRN